MFRVPLLSVIVTLASFLLLCMLYIDLQRHHACEMTWMYQRPQYQRINLSDEVEATFPQYSLHLYKESRQKVDPTLSRPPVLSGIPVLFIPGNAGSYKQVRSSASIALRMYPMEFKDITHFDFFTVNLNEELSGMFGGVLERQTTYVAVCIQHILSMYTEVSNPPQSVAIIAHSMGGLIAQSLFAHPDFNHSTVHTIVTLASPLKRPVLSFDHKLQQFYDNIEKVWSVGGMSSQVTVVSIAGGERDVQVLPHLTRLDYSISISTAAIPRNWVSADHQAVVWCRRVQLAVTRALFLLQDTARRELTRDMERKYHIFSHYLFTGRKVPMGSPSMQLHMQSWTVLGSDYHWQEMYQPGYSALAVPHSNWTASNKALIIASNTDSYMWAYTCASLDHKIAECTGISNMAKLLPPKDGVIKYITLEALPPGTSHVVVSQPRGQVARTKTNVFVLVEKCERIQYELQLTLWGGDFSFPSNHCTVINFSLPNLQELWQVYTATVTSCAPLSAGMVTPWYPQSSLQHSNGSQQLSVSLSLLVPPPPNNRPYLVVWATHSCPVEISVKPDIFGLIGKLAVLYAPLLPLWITAVSIATPATHTALEMAAIVVLYSLTSMDWLPGTDWELLMKEGVWLPWVPPLLHLLARGLQQMIVLVLVAVTAFIQRRIAADTLWMATCVLIGVSLLASLACSGLSLLCALLAYGLNAVDKKDHQLLCVLLCLQFLAMPSLFSWVKGIGYSVSLGEDPHFWTILVANTISIATLLLRPKKGISATTTFCGMLFPLPITWDSLLQLAVSLALLLYSLTHAYRSIYFIIGYLAFSAFKQTIFPLML